MWTRGRGKNRVADACVRLEQRVGGRTGGDLAEMASEREGCLRLLCIAHGPGCAARSICFLSRLLICLLLPPFAGDILVLLEAEREARRLR